MSKSDRAVMGMASLWILLLAFLGVIIVSLFAFASWFLWASADVGAAYGAKLMASGVFIAERDPRVIAKEDLGFIPFLQYVIDKDAYTVTARIMGCRPKTAVYRDGLGVAVAHDASPHRLRRQAHHDLAGEDKQALEIPWPRGDGASGNARPIGIDGARLAAAVDCMFAEPARGRKKRTRAVVIVYKGEIVAERYAEGYGPDQRFLGWSLAKGVIHALYGIAVRAGKLSVQDTTGLWRESDDPRSEITIDMLLRMSSGLAWDEYDFMPPTNLATMLFLEANSGAYAASMPLESPPDTVWTYSSGATNMLSLILRNIYGDEAYYRLPYQELFEKINMRSAVIEADASGTFVGSSFIYATARDYARFGLLYLQDGVWQGERILPEGWVEYGRTRSHRRKYGAHWWRPSASQHNEAAARGISLPRDMFYASGFEGQTIVVIPSREIVVVRLGLAYLTTVSPFNYLYDILEAFPE